MVAKKVTTTRAGRSGFPSKLSAWIAHNRDEYEAGRGVHGPRNGRQLAKALSADGEECSDNTVRAWMRGDSLPEARYISLVERMMGAPWGYLDDPRTPWPPTVADRELFRLVLTATAAQRAVAGAALRRLVRERGGE